MENPHTIICLHSKYSSNCKRFFEICSQNDINYVVPVCIDNKEIRERVVQSQIQIQFVPCLLFIYSGGNIEKYEGDAAFRWVEEIVNNKRQYEEQMLRSQEPPKETLTQIPEVEIQEEKKITPKKKKKIVIEESEDEEDIEEEIIPVKKTKNKVVRVSEKSPEETKTDINDLLDLGEDDNNQFSGFLATSKNQTEKPAVKKDNPLMLKVQEMQRMRDAEDAKLPKRP